MKQYKIYSHSVSSFVEDEMNDLSKKGWSVFYYNTLLNSRNEVVYTVCMVKDA
jgi:hypothetical protein